MNKKLQIECNRFTISLNKFKTDLKDKQFQKKFAFAIIDSSITVTLLLTFLIGITIPILNHVTTYEKQTGYDPLVALSSLAFALIGIWVVTFPVARTLSYPIGKLLGVIGTKPTMPKNWKKQK